MYQFSDEINNRAFFWFRRSLIQNKNWAMLSKPAKAVYPVIACHANKNGVAFPSEETISALAGLTPKRVRQGVKDLEGFPGFTWDYYVTKRGWRSKKFFLSLPKAPSHGEAFPFHRFIIEGGNWQEIGSEEGKAKAAAKALYPVMRHFGFFDIEEYLWIEDMEEEASDFSEVYPNRRYDFCDAEKGVLAEYAGIDRTSINRAIEELARRHLIGNFEDRPGWKVYLHPPKFYKRAYLNEKLMMKNYRSKV